MNICSNQTNVSTSEEEDDQHRSSHPRHHRPLSRSLTPRSLSRNNPIYNPSDESIRSPSPRRNGNLGPSPINNFGSGTSSDDDKIPSPTSLLKPFFQHHYPYDDETDPPSREKRKGLYLYSCSSSEEEIIHRLKTLYPYQFFYSNFVSNENYTDEQV